MSAVAAIVVVTAIAMGLTALVLVILAIVDQRRQ